MGGRAVRVYREYLMSSAVRPLPFATDMLRSIEVRIRVVDEVGDPLPQFETYWITETYDEDDISDETLEGMLQVLLQRLRRRPL